MQDLEGRAGGAYIPPAKLRALQAQITDKTSEPYQKMAWEALKKSINGLINKVNVANLKEIVLELFAENLVRGKGLLCRSLMKAQTASQPFTPVFAAVVAVINTKFPMIGELLIMRLLSQFRKAYKRSDKAACLSSTTFLAHLVNQKVANELIALQILVLLLEKPTDDSVEVAVGYMRQVGAFLLQEDAKACSKIFERFRTILNQGKIAKRTQYMVEVLFQVRKDKFSSNPSIQEGLDLIEDEDQITHLISLTDGLNTQDNLHVFHFDDEFLENERQYEIMKKEILGEEGSSDESGDEGENTSYEEEADAIEKREMQIKDHTNTNLVNLRRAIYLTIMSSLNFEESAHKLLKLNIPEGLEIELANMVIECCSQERSYVTFYGLLGERFCKLTPEWAQTFTAAFEEIYKTIHRYESNRIRNIAKFYAHLLATDAISWEVFALVRITEADTTSSSRIFCKVLFQELAHTMGMKQFAERLNDKDMVVTVETNGGLITRGVFDGLFPMDNPANTRFAINYFTSISLGALTEQMRETLKIMQANVDSESESESEDDSAEESEVESRESRPKMREVSRSPSPDQPNGRRDSRSLSPRKRRAASRSNSPSPRRSYRDTSPARGRSERYLSRSPRPSPHRYSKGYPTDERKGRYRSRSPSRKSSPRYRRRESRSRSPPNRRDYSPRDYASYRRSSPKSSVRSRRNWSPEPRRR